MILNVMKEIERTKITIIYVTMARIPGEKAHSIQIVRTCTYLGLEGAEVILLAPQRGLAKVLGRRIEKYLEKYYGIKRAFKLIYVKTPNLIHLKRVGWFFMCVILSMYAALFSLIISSANSVKRNKTILYIREPLPYILTKLFTFNLIPTVYEVHDMISVKRLFRALINKASLVISLNQSIAQHMKIALNNINKLIVVPHGADERLFHPTIRNAEISYLKFLKNYAEQQSKKIIMYAGQLAKWKNLEFIIDAMSKVGREDILLVIIGGSADDINRLRNYCAAKNLNNIVFLGNVKPSEVPKYLSLADILIHYSPGNSSPLKIPEYMLMRKPILAPNSVEILMDGINALLFNPKSPEDLALKINKLLADPIMAKRIAEEAYIEAKEKYTYRSRAKEIINHLSSLT